MSLSVSSCVHKLIFAFYSFLHSSCLCLVMLAPCRSSSMPSLTCLRAAVMKTLRRRRRILHGFSLGPGTPLHGVGVCAFVCACSVTCRLHVPVVPGGLPLTAHQCTRVTVGKIYKGAASGLVTRFHNNHIYRWWVLNLFPAEFPSELPTMFPLWLLFRSAKVSKFCVSQDAYWLRAAFVLGRLSPLASVCNTPQCENIFSCTV